jgi:CRISPR-associated protein Csb2
MGFDEQACLALRKLNKVWGHGGHDIRLVLHGIGEPDDFKECALFGTARAWRSLTPFVSTRHAKTFRDGRPKIDANGWQIGSGGHDLLRLLSLDSRCAGVKIRKLSERDRPFHFQNKNLRALQFQTIRHKGGGSRGSTNGDAFSIMFAKAVIGPLAFGYGAHFGLGLFVPVPDQPENKPL